MVAETPENPKEMPDGHSKGIWAALSTLPLPGSAGWQGDLGKLTSRCEQEASALASGGVDGIVLENRHDGPFTARMETAGAVAMADMLRRVKKLTGLPVGVTVYRNDIETSLAIALNAQASFVRIPLLAGAMFEESGVVEGCLNTLSAYRKRVPGAEHVPLWADISVRHAFRKPFSAGESPVAYLVQLIEAVAAYGWVEKLVLIADAHVTPPVVMALKEQITDLPILIDVRAGLPELPAYYAVSDGVLLSGGLEKSAAFEPGLPAAVDMTKAEELVSKLKKIKSVDQIDPDFFLTQMYGN